MKITRWIKPILALLFLAACGGVGSSTPTSSLPTAQVNVTHAPSAEGTLRSYLDALLVEDYPSMYALLTQSSRSALSQEDFAGRHTDALNAMSVSKIEYNILSTLTDPQSAQATFHITYKTVLFGDIQRDFNVTMSMENDEWRLQWDTGLILPELAGGKRLVTNYTPTARGDIYDRNGNAVVTQADIVALGLVAGEVTDENKDTVINKLFQLTGVRPEIILNDYDNYPAGQYVPVGEASVEAVNQSGILNFSGVQENPYTSRFYEPNAAPHVTGYTQAIFPEEVVAYRRLGYSGGEMVGKTGIEKWGEDYLRGREAATLSVVATDGTYENTLSQVNSKPADSVYLTIDNDLQEQAQAAMDGLPGAIVVMELSTGRVLAMVSSPSYDPNLFDSQNRNSINLSNMVNNAEELLVNRATQGQYPLGSVFKIVTMAAALESGVFTPQDTFDCQYTFTDIPGQTLYDWTYQHCEDEKAQTGNDTCSGANAQPSGLLTLPKGLMRSCDPWFYHIGYELWKQDKGNLISDMALSFGLGKATGIDQVAEAEGSIPNPTDGLDATHIAIGQGKVLVTPLQVATFIAAVGNGGTLYRPQLVEKIQPVSGDPVNVFKPQANDTLLVTPENLKVIQDAMRSVAADPKGTAYYTLGNFAIPTAVKTGTAESGDTNPHAWFAGYSLVNAPDKSDIAVVVLVNNKGEGATWAAPIFRRVMEIYFFGHPQTVYPWESNFGVINPDYGQPAATPTPQP